MQYLDIVLFALLAAFVLFRLGRVLGRRPDDSGAPRPFGRPRQRDNVVALPGRAQPRLVDNDLPAADASETALAANAMAPGGVAEIRLNDPSFDAAQFVTGAKHAYEMIVTAFAHGDRDTLRRLLTRDVYENFTRAIAEREAAGERLETSVVGIGTAEIIDARMAGRTAEVTVRFVSELMNTTWAKDGKAEGEGPDAIKTVTDVWTFARDTRNSDPNWALAETRSHE